MVDEDGHVKRQLPDGLDLGSIPCLVSTSDQGPNNVAALNFCMFSNQTLLFGRLGILFTDAGMTSSHPSRSPWLQHGGVSWKWL